MHFRGKLRYTWESAHKWKDKSPREPLLLLSEFAAEVGVTSQSLAAILSYASRRGDPHPKHVDGVRNGSINRRYYKASELRQWWANRQSQESQNVKAVD